MTAAYRTAIVGTGAIADAHARAVHAVPERARIVAAVDVDVPRAKEFARTWDVPKIYASVAELLTDGDVDLVHVCTPPRSHLSVALECLAAGVTVLVEKPPVLSLSTIDTLTAAESRSSARVASVFQHRFGSAAVRLRRLAADGVLGRPLVATCRTLWYRDDEYFAAPWRGSWADEGGGPTMEHGIHQFDLLLSVLGRRLSARETSALRFDFEHATVEVEHLYGYRDTDWTVTPAPGREDFWLSGVDIPSGHEAQITAVFDALDRGEPPPVTLQDARDTMAFIAALYESAFTGGAVHHGQVSAEFAARMDGTGAPWRDA
jgi:predicted dehydrogenase